MSRPKHAYRSQLEVITAGLLKASGIKFKYEARKIPFRSRVKSGICGECECREVFQVRSYLPDFELPDGRIVEAKGKLTSSERTKFLAIRASNPNLYVCFVFGADNKLTKSKPRRYSDWCKDNDFDYGIKQLPASIKSGGLPAV